MGANEIKRRERLGQASGFFPIAFATHSFALVLNAFAG